MPSFLSGQTDLDAIETLVTYTALHIDTPQPSYFDFGTPIFDGSIDWHSSVHAHLATVIDYQTSGDDTALEAFVDARFAAEDVQAEADANVPDQYGWAWLLKLDETMRDAGYDDLSVAGDAYAERLADVLEARGDAGTLDTGEGSYGDTFWQVANLHQWAVSTGDATMTARAEDIFDEIVADADITAAWDIEDGDFFSAVGIATYAHVVVGETDTPLFGILQTTLTEAAENGELDTLLADEGAALESGAGYGHAPGVPISLGYGYWALFTETQDPVHYEAFEKITEWTETHAEAMGADIGTGHWLPNFAAFGLSLPTDLEVAETPELLATLQDYGLDVTPLDEGDDTLVGGEGDDDLGVSFAIGGADAQLFTIDPETGDVALQDWFTPSFDDAWDIDEDHVYEVTVIGFDADGAEVSRTGLEMVVSAEGVVWQDGDATTEDPDNDPMDEEPEPETPSDGAAFSLEGPDALLFTVDAATGAVAQQDWFTPSVDDPWDMDDNNLYEITVVETDADGVEVARTGLELLVTADGAVWQDGTPGGSDEPEDDGSDPAPSDAVYSLDGPDAFLFDVDTSGGVTAKDWFTPDFNDPWDAGEDNVYNLSVVQSGDSGETGRTDLTFEVGPDNVLTPVLSGDAIMQALFVAQDPEEEPAPDDEDTDLPEMA